MIQLNKNFSLLQSSYLFVEIANRVNQHKKSNPGAEIIHLGIGDVTKPLTPAVIAAFHKGVSEMAEESSFRGYGPEQGYAFLRQTIAENDYKGCSINPDDIFISDGAKCDSANFQELFATDIRIALPDPVYPVYVDSNVMAGRASATSNGRYGQFIYLEGTTKNNFVPGVGSVELYKPDLIYLCFPNNPTGEAASREQLQNWVDWANAQDSIILFDAAYEAFVTDTQVPRSIYEIPGAETCAVEFRSFSKTAGFTGTRCAFTVVPETIGNSRLRDMWLRRQSTKFNGVSYPVQKAAAAIYTEQGKKETLERIQFYLQNAKIIKDTMELLNFECWGGINSPYVWVKTGRDSWATFDQLLTKTHVVVTPGSGFGLMGEGFIRISAFNHRHTITNAMNRIKKEFNSGGLTQ